MWNENKKGTDRFTASEWIEKLANLLGLSQPHDGDEVNRLRREGDLIPVKVLHDGKTPQHPNTSG